MIKDTMEKIEATDESRGEGTREGTGDGGVGDVEAAGETTAAATIGGKTDDRPVGADTLVKVEGDPDINQSRSRQS